MTRFLFWNYRYDGPNKEELLERLILEEAVDIVLLAESSIDRRNVLDRLEAAGRPFAAPRDPHPLGLIEVLAAYPQDSFVNDWARDADRIWLRRVKIPGRLEILVGAVHLVSGLHRDRIERLSEATAVARTVREAQVAAGVGHERTLIVGDFNLNPFDDGMVFPQAFGAMMSKSLVRKNRQSVDGHCGRFYNPSWARIGQEEDHGPPGTYYWNSNRELNPYWNSPDQVLLGADLLDHFPADRFRILTAIPGPDGPVPLIRETERHWVIQISDHLPLIFDVDLPAEGEIDGR